MIEGLIYSPDKPLKNELMDILPAVPGVNVIYVNNTNDINKYLNNSYFSFVLVAAEISQNKSDLIEWSRQYPQVYFVYYTTSLNIDNLQQSEFMYFNYIVVGENRKPNLQQLLVNLSKTYWKKIPFDKIGINYLSLSPRLKKVMNYIESHDLKNTTIAKISEYLDISQGYFSQEFKRETGQTFREFMQKLLDYYERIIFENLDLSAKTVSQILGYSELSSFSRSFKKRKGYPPSLQKNHKIRELRSFSV